MFINKNDRVHRRDPPTNTTRTHHLKALSSGHLVTTYSTQQHPNIHSTTQTVHETCTFSTRCKPFFHLTPKDQNRQTRGAYLNVATHAHEVAHFVGTHRTCKLQLFYSCPHGRKMALIPIDANERPSEILWHDHDLSRSDVDITDRCV